MTQESYASAELLFAQLLLVVCCCCGYLLQSRRVHWLPPSSAAVLLGLCAGGTLRLRALAAGYRGGRDDLVDGFRFSADTLFYGLLPPIIYGAGLNLNHKSFFRNGGSILLFAVVGTIISSFVFGFLTWFLVLAGAVDKRVLGSSPLLECLMYGTLVSAIDPVATLSVFSDLGAPPVLYNLVFGESVLNDAVSIVLFRAVESAYGSPITVWTVPNIILQFAVVSVGSLAVGTFGSLACALVIKRLDLRYPRDDSAFDPTVYAFSIVVVSSYLSYLLAEACGMSGIFCIFFSGILHSHYVLKSVTDEARTVIEKTVESVAFLSETFLFAYLGLQVMVFPQVPDAGLLLSALPLCLLSRAANIFPLARLANKHRRVPITHSMQMVQWACGLRGGIAYALAANMPNARPDDEYDGNPAFETATLFVVVTTTLVFGGLTSPLLNHFGLVGNTRQYESLADTSASAVEEEDRRSKLHEAWRKFDREWLKPIFGASEGEEVGSPRSAPEVDMVALAEGDGYLPPALDDETYDSPD